MPLPLSMLDAVVGNGGGAGGGDGCSRNVLRALPATAGDDGSRSTLRRCLATIRAVESIIWGDFGDVDEWIEWTGEPRQSGPRNDGGKLRSTLHNTQNTAKILQDWPHSAPEQKAHSEAMSPTTTTAAPPGDSRTPLLGHATGSASDNAVPTSSAQLLGRNLFGDVRALLTQVRAVQMASGWLSRALSQCTRLTTRIAHASCRSAAFSCSGQSSPSSFRTRQGKREHLRGPPCVLAPEIELILATPLSALRSPPLSPTPSFPSKASSRITLLHSHWPSSSLPKVFSPCSPQAPATTRRKGWRCTRSSRSSDCLLVSGSARRHMLPSGSMLTRVNPAIVTAAAGVSIMIANKVVHSGA